MGSTGKQYPIKLARACALLTALIGILTAGLYMYISGGSFSDPTSDGIIVAAVGLFIALMGILLVFILPKYHKVLIGLMLILLLASVPALSTYVLLLRMALTTGPIGVQWFLPIALPVVWAVLLIWLIVTSVRRRTK